MTPDAALHDMDWSDWDADWADADAHAYAAAPGLPVALSAEMIPFDRDGLPLASHLDADDVLHFFAAVDHALRPDLGDRSAELRYFRAARTDDGRLAHDARPVMPLAHAGDAPFPRPALETMLLDGDLENAQELAWHTAQAHGLAFPAPEDLPPLLEAERRLGIVPADALRLLATLYDAAWITHPEAAPPARLYADARDFIRSEYGAAYVPEEPTAPAAGIAPADIRRIPDALPGDGAALYRLIWTRFVAAQLPPARLRQTGVQLGVGADRERPYPLTLWGLHTRIAFDGWLRLMPEALSPSEDEPPEVLAGDAVRVAEIEVERIAPPDAGMTAAALIARHGSARPAAWCAALQALEAADLVRMDGDRLTVSERGAALAAWLGERFPALVGDDADSGLERALQHIAAGTRERDPVVHAFRERLSADLRRASPPRPVVLRPAREV